MMSPARFLRKLRLLLTRKNFRDELNEEMEFHRAAAERAFVADGMTPKEARYAAQRQFGNETRLREQSHEIVGFRTETILQDLRYALRQLRRNPGFGITAVLILALGIAASVSIFGFVDAALIKPLPYRSPDRLVAAYESCTLGPKFHLSYLDYLDWKKLNTVFRSLDVYETSDFILSTPEGAQHVNAVRVTAGFFHTLGVTPVLGRDFHPGEDQPSAAPALLLSYSTWQQRFGGKDVLGNLVTLDGRPRTIIGVLPRDFSFAPGEPAEFWLALHQTKGCEENRGCHNLYGVARLNDGVSLASASAEMSTIARQLELKYPTENRDQGAYLTTLSDAVVGDIRPVLLVLLSGAALLLIVACINVGSLLLVRTESRRHEIAVRGALGASPKRLLRQFAIEALVLAGISSVIGVTFASVAMHLLPRLIPPDMLATMPYLHGLGLNGRVLAFSGGVLVAMETVFALTPTARLSWSEMRAGLGEGGRSSVGRLWRRLGSSLVIVELAVALVLLSGAGLLCRSLYRLLRVNIGFVPERLVTMQIEPPDAEYGNDAKVIALEGSIVHRISALPGVKSIGAANRLPVGDGDGTSNILLIGRSQGKHYEVNDRQVGANYFQTIGAQLLRGRYFAESEDASKPRVVIINQAFAERLFPGEDPIGKHIGYRGPHLNRMEIVGVVSNIKEGPLDMTVRPAFYVPFNQAPSRWMSIVIRTSQDERSLLPVLSAILHEIDRGIAVYSVTTMEQRINESPSTYLHRSAAWLAGGFAVIALLLGVVGLYGVIAYSVSQRTREIGVRMALGARRTTVYGMVLHEALRLILVGISAGVAGSLLTTGLLRPLLYGVRPWDATTLGGVAVLLGIAALFATYVPARRAASVNPVDALRAE